MPTWWLESFVIYFKLNMSHTEYLLYILRIRLWYIMFHSSYWWFESSLFYSYVSLGGSLSIIMNSSKNQHFALLNISTIFFFFSFIDFCSHLYYFPLRLALGLFCSSFSGFLRWDLRLLTWDISSFLMCASSVINFSLSTALTVFHNVFYCDKIYIL